MKGKVGEREGIFPAAFVDIVEPLPAGEQLHVSTGIYCCMPDRSGGLEDKITVPLKLGVVELMRAVDNQWLKGKMGKREDTFYWNIFN